MKLHLVKPDLPWYEQFQEMMAEWRESNTRIAPWFLDIPVKDPEDFAGWVRMLDDCSHGIVDKRFAATTSYLVADENNRLVGAASLRHYLTEEGFQTWGHIGYGIRPGERRKGYAVQSLQLMLQEAKRIHLGKVLIGVYDSNIGSWKTVEKCGGVLENIAYLETEDEGSRRYWIDLKEE